PWEYDSYLYKQRNIIERLFRWLKAFRRVCTRYDKLDLIFLSFVQIACISTWLKYCQQALESVDLVRKRKLFIRNISLDHSLCIEIPPQFFKIDRGTTSMENLSTQKERFVSSVIGEGGIIMIMVSLLVIILIVGAALRSSTGKQNSLNRSVTTAYSAL
ncbi:MAG: hypothetical protein K5695_17495, partial [Oscillospiraceae bacterium]|nr:hypothetical protein [Oscillospiraceae bacterium]